MFVGFHPEASRLNIAVFTIAVAMAAVLILATRRPDAYTVSRGLLVNAGPDTLHAIINTDTMIGKDCAVGLAHLKALAAVPFSGRPLHRHHHQKKPSPVRLACK